LKALEQFSSLYRKWSPHLLIWYSKLLLLIVKNSLEFRLLATSIKPEGELHNDIEAQCEETLGQVTILSS
jgi:hypothetical protein